MQKSAWIAALFLSVMSFQVHGADSSSGCGPGWYLFKENSLVSSAFRATTNGFLYPVVTVGMTIGTSNCTQHKLVLKEKESLYFATHNHYELKADMAKGQGEYLTAFATTMGCPSSSHDRLNSQLRSQFSKIYSDSNVNPETTLLETYKVIFSDKELTQQCSLGAA